MPREALPRHIGLSAHDIEWLAGLGEGYLERKGTVVQFARLRAATAEPAAPARGSTVVPFPSRSKP